MAERLERLIVSERRLLGDISHELRSPLARLKFAVKLARTSHANQAALDRIERDVDRITSLVADIVEITFIEGDPAVQDTEMVRAGEIIDEVVRDCALEAQFRDCSIEVSGRLAGRDRVIAGRPRFVFTGGRGCAGRIVPGVAGRARASEVPQLAREGTPDGRHGR